MAIERVELTTALASKLMENPHPRQRRPARGTVTQYANEIRRGRWRPYVPDALLVDSEGRLFNGAHRCAAVIAAGMGIGVLIEYGADPELFDVIDIGRKRSAYQFISEGEAASRAAAARIMLWYRNRIERPLSGPSLAYFDLSEVLAEAERSADAMSQAMPHARAIHGWTGIGQSITLAVLVLAADDGYSWDQLVAFREGIVDPSGLDADDARRVLADKTRQQRWRDRRRQAMDDWTVLVRTLNAYLNDERITAVPLSRFWPLIGESALAYNRRRQALVDRSRPAQTSMTDASVMGRQRRRRRAG